MDEPYVPQVNDYVVWDKGEFGIDGYFIGVPTVIGSGGVEKILEFDLKDEEKLALNNTLEAVKNTVKETGL